MTAIAWAIFCFAISSADAAYAFKHGERYEASPVSATFFIVGMIGLVISTVVELSNG